MYETYHEWLPVGRHPVFALFIDIAPDWRCQRHPSKRECAFLTSARFMISLFVSRHVFKSQDRRAGSLRTAAPPLGLATATAVS